MMKSTYKLFLLLVLAVAMTSCDKVNFKKTKYGLIYKIFPSNSKDSVAKVGQWLKLHYVQYRVRDKDSVLQSSYGRMPTYQMVSDNPDIKYNPAEIFPLLKKGDSAIVVMLVDSLVNKGLAPQLPPFLKKGDRLELRFKVIDVFRDQDKYQADFEAERKKDEPNAIAEQKKMMEDQKRMIDSMMRKELEDYEKSGEAARQRKEIEDYLAKKNINAEKAANGTYVHITQQGTGAQADSGKYLMVKYAGRVMSTDSAFDSGTYPVQLNVTSVIQGWHDGLKLFKGGGKGTLYIPAYRAYGREGRPGSPIGQNAHLIFDVEVLSVTDTPPGGQPGP